MRSTSYVNNTLRNKTYFYGYQSIKDSIKLPDLMKKSKFKLSNKGKNFIENNIKNTLNMNYVNALTIQNN